MGVSAASRGPLAVVSIIGLLAGCTARAAEPRPSANPRAFETRFEESETRPYAPRPAAGSPAEEPPAPRVLALSGGERQARQLALSLLQALIDADDAQLARLFGAEVVRVLDGRTLPREELIATCLERASALAYEPGLGIGDLIDLEALEVRSIRELHPEHTLPFGLLESDLAVELEPRNLEAFGLTRHIPCLTQLYVRTGVETRVVGLGR